MAPTEDKAKQEIWLVLREIKHLSLITREDHFIQYDIVERSDVPGYATTKNQVLILEKLEHLGVLKIVGKRYLASNGMFIDFPLQGTVFSPRVIKLEILQPKFDRMIASQEGSDFSQDATALYVTKEGDDFLFYGKIRSLSTKSRAYKVFCALFALLPRGGEVSYADLGVEIKNRITETKNYSKERMVKLIQTTLTDKNNGILHYAEIANTQDNGKPLLSIKRGHGIIFNNKRG